MMDTIKGKDLKIGMTAQRLSHGKLINHPMFIYGDGPYYKNSLYADDDFVVIKDIKMKLDGDKMLADLTKEVERLRDQESEVSLGSLLTIVELIKSIRVGNYTIKD